MIGPPEHIALLSLPMLSLMRAAQRLRGAALGVIGALIPESGNALPPGRIQYTSEAPHVRGRLRLLGRLVRVNRPWLLFTGLSRALPGMFATAAFGLMSIDIWRVTLYVGPLRDAVFTLLSIRTPVRLPGQSDTWAWQGNTGRLIGPDMRMRSRAPSARLNGKPRGREPPRRPQPEVAVMTVMSIARFERFFRVAAGLDVDKNDLKRYSDFIDAKLYDLLTVAQATAKANGRDIIRTCDLPITKGLQESIHHFRKIDQEVELKPILEQLATHPALDRTPDEETEAAYPDIIGGLSLALAQSFKILHPDLKNPQTQHWDEARAVFDLLL
ncbi:DUF1931 family protein [Streptomyces sp. LZ34]